MPREDAPDPLHQASLVAPLAAARGVSPLLIANRGEIALRIARTARRLGITTIAVHSDADRASPHVGACDMAIPIGGATSAESYLRAETIIAAARQAGAAAIHPGYGFLAENAAFAASVVAADLVFVGPPAAAIAAMGDKAAARRRMAASGIAVIEGYDEADQSEAAFTAAAARIGFPIMVKAAAGGGGRGMRLVAEPAALPVALRAAAAEAAAAFGDGRLILERALIAPRHVEIQVFADAAGHIVHLGERDCSVQRRHQKIIEEAPSPALTEALRAEMGAAAIAVARAIGYVGAGTVEFLLDRDGRFYFMEMNTRLQVEHPVTERVTGLDLVEWQLRIAGGEPLALRQDEIRHAGHAVEVRLCAEEPADDFLPRTGTVLFWEPGHAARCDAALAPGLAISPFYDSMLGKLIAHGATRAEAIDRLVRALEETVLLGVPTNRNFLIRLLRHPAFAAGDTVSTAFIPTHFPDNATRAAPPDDTAWTLAAWLAAVASPQAAAWSEAWRGWSNALPLPRPWRLATLAPVAAERSGQAEIGRGRAVIRMDGVETAIEGTPAPAAGADCRARVGGVAVRYRFAWQDDALWLKLGAHDHVFVARSRTSRVRPPGEAGSDGVLRAPMNGRVVQLAAAPGDPIERGATVLTLEAMKMEVALPAPLAGRLAVLAVAPGEQVTLGQILGRIEPAG